MYWEWEADLSNDLTELSIRRDRFHFSCTNYNFGTEWCQKQREIVPLWVSSDWPLHCKKHHLTLHYGDGFKWLFKLITFLNSKLWISFLCRRTIWWDETLKRSLNVASLPMLRSINSKKGNLIIMSFCKCSRMSIKWSLVSTPLSPAISPMVQ